MGLARELARLRPNTSGQLPTANIQDSAITDAKIAAMAASKLSGQVPDANAPSGSVIQVVLASTGTQISVSSTSYTATSLQVTINKQISSSTILIIASPNVQAYNSGAGEGKAGGRIYETTGSREIHDFNCVVRQYDGGDVGVSSPNVCLQCVDSQSGTGNRTYRFDLKKITGADARLNIDNNGEANSQITAWEIAP